jgi:arginase family enzyme
MPEPGFASPIARFFDATTTAPVPGGVAFLGMPSDATHTSRIGTRFGPRALRHETTALIRRLRADMAGGGLLDTRSGLAWSLADADGIADLGDAAIDESDVGATVEAIAAMTERAVRAGALPVAIGGDHFNSYPACLGVSRALAARAPGARFGYIQIDGHLDFGDRLGAWGALNHATNARRVSELPNIDPANMVWIGIHGWVDGEDVAAIERLGGLIIPASSWHRDGSCATAARAIAHALRDCETLYLSIDIDAMDAGFLPGTGSIVHSEITLRQYLDLLGALAAAPLCGVDLVEVSPPLDPSGRSERIAARLLLEALRPHLLAASPVGDAVTTPGTQ